MRRLALSLLGFITVSLSSCSSGGHFEFLGYTTKPNYDDSIHTVYLPVIQNKAFQAGPLRGLEYELTEELQRQIEMKTPYKITHDRERADTELLGTIIATPKNILNRNQLNEIREGEMVIRVEIVWKNLHTGQVLSAPPPNNVIQASGRFLPELGESTTTALQQACQKAAVQIISLMEKPWQLHGVND
ncbi:MAG TPA: LPS assembly lipoprotein LptE [Gemmataceae bacterium]|nr:LPS assembly lipoprotein LptE [Gemmataceae bacterium]